MRCLTCTRVRRTRSVCHTRGQYLRTSTSVSQTSADLARQAGAWTELARHGGEYTSATDSSLSSSRRLLDTTKLEFRTDATASVADMTVDAQNAPLVLVSAHSGGATPRGLGAGGGVLVYDITLSPLTHGLPSEALQLRMWLAGCAVGVMLAALCCVPVGGSFQMHPAHRFRRALMRKARLDVDS